MCNWSDRCIQKFNRFNSGYTMLEVTLAVTIAIIIGSSVTWGLRTYMLETAGDRQSIAIWREISSLKSKVMKYDIPYLLQFNSTTTLGYTIYRDLNRDNNHDAGEAIVEDAGVKTTEVITLGQIGGASGPNGLDASATLVGNWASGADNYIIVKNDVIATITSGGVYFRHTRLPNMGFCICVHPGSQQVRLYKYKGGSWLEM